MNSSINTLRCIVNNARRRFIIISVIYASLLLLCHNHISGRVCGKATGMNYKYLPVTSSIDFEMLITRRKKDWRGTRRKGVGGEGGGRGRIKLIRGQTSGGCSEIEKSY